jgi:hypothetical protein
MNTPFYFIFSFSMDSLNLLFKIEYFQDSDTRSKYFPSKVSKFVDAKSTFDVQGALAGANFCLRIEDRPKKLIPHCVRRWAT